MHWLFLRMTCSLGITLGIRLCLLQFFCTPTLIVVTLTHATLSSFGTRYVQFLRNVFLALLVELLLSVSLLMHGFGVIHNKLWRLLLFQFVSRKNLRLQIGGLTLLCASGRYSVCSVMCKLLNRVVCLDCRLGGL